MSREGYNTDAKCRGIIVERFPCGDATGDGCNSIWSGRTIAGSHGSG